jgi:hypothetical protein
VRLGARRCTSPPSARAQSPDRGMLTRSSRARGSPTRTPEPESTADEDQPRYRISKPTREPLPPSHTGRTTLREHGPCAAAASPMPESSPSSRLITHAQIRQEDTIRVGPSMSYDATYAGLPSCLARRSSAPSTVDGLLMRPSTRCRRLLPYQATTPCDRSLFATRQSCRGNASDCNQQAATWTLGSGPPSSVGQCMGC